MAVSPLIEAGNVYLPHPMYAPWVNDFIEECAAFPNGAHDDQVDAMTQALLRWNMIPRQPVVYFDEYEYELHTRISPI
jgi:phage terminase large subunit-like protein